MAAATGGRRRRRHGVVVVAIGVSVEVDVVGVCVGMSGGWLIVCW